MLLDMKSGGGRGSKRSMELLFPMREMDVGLLPVHIQPGGEDYSIMFIPFIAIILKGIPYLLGCGCAPRTTVK